MRVTEKLNVAFAVAAVFVLAGGVAAVYLISNLNESFKQIEACNFLLEQVAEANRGLRATPQATKQNEARLNDLERWAPAGEARALASEAVQNFRRNDLAASLDVLDKLGTHFRGEDRMAHANMLRLHRRARIVVMVAVFEGALLLVLLAWFVRESFVRPTQQLRSAAVRIAKGESPPPLHFEGKDEFSELADALQQAAGTLEQQRERAEHHERLAAIGEACTHIAHNIRSLLSSIKTLAQYEREAPTATDDSRAAFDYISGTVDTLDRWAGDMIHSVKPLECKLARQSLEPIVHDVLALYQPRLSERGVQVKFEMGESCAEVLVDRQLMQRAIGALLSNAVDASPDNGQIHLRAANGTDTSVVLAIQDQGDGIPADIREKVFVPFFTTKRGYSGLGLSIASRIAAAHNGCITIVDTGGKGACVCIQLPAAPADRRSTR